MGTLHLVSHTHWDREWYLTFQQFRLKLVSLVDELLSIMQADPDYKHFTLDGQTIVLEDYLQMRPEREAEIRALIQSGRLLAGPWHVLPDEFLVSPEAIVRNLLQGDQTAKRFGPKMMIGYLPDPFGHIGQMPQILQGFGIDSACLQRGLSDEPCELWWQAPDGSRVFLAYLRDGYGNAASLAPQKPDSFVADVERLRASLQGHCLSGQYLLMHGTDHMPPQLNTSAAIGYANEHLDGHTLIHSTLPQFLEDVRTALGEQPDLPIYHGEMRSSKRHNLLPGVLSTRTWIKQRNHACETLLEKWAEPFSTFADLATRVPELTFPTASILKQAWRYLLECQPHDSICGCSIDQVHEEMRPRFDQVEQIGEEITSQSLETLAERVNTRFSAVGDAQVAVVVFNPVSGPRTDEVQAWLPLSSSNFEIMDEAGRVMPYRLGEQFQREVAKMALDRQGLLSLLSVLQNNPSMLMQPVAGQPIPGLGIRQLTFRRRGDTLYIQAWLATGAEPAGTQMEGWMSELGEALTDESLNRFEVQAHLNSTSVHFLARDVPGIGYKTFWVRPGKQAVKPSMEPDVQRIQNEFFIVEASPTDGSLTLTDKRTGAVFPKLNRFTDGGDCGDTYNYCPPPQDEIVTAQVEAICCTTGPAGETLEIKLHMQIPAELAPGRDRRSTERTPLTILTRATLLPGVERLDIRSEVDNRASDHRLRVHFSAPFQVDQAYYDGHFEVVTRPVDLPAYDETWGEEPRPEHPQRLFTAISGGLLGLALANRGLREAATIRGEDGNTEIALTLLRCVGWLSRDDIPGRNTPAGPGLATPGAQMHGNWEFEYSVLPYSGGWQNAFQGAQAFNAPMRSAVTAVQKGSLPPAMSFIDIEPESFAISTIKAAEAGDGWIVRGYNLESTPAQVTVRTWQPFRQVTRVSLAEEPREAVPIGTDGRLRLEVRGHGIETVKFN